MPTGLELLQAMLAGELPPAAMASHFKMGLAHAEEGRVVFECQADKTHLNPMGSVHGGFAATLLDTACGCAVMSTLPAGVGYTTVDLSVKMMRPVPMDTPLICEGKIQKPGARVAFVEAWLRTADGKLLAHATSTCAVFSP